MSEVLLAKYGELALKGLNRSSFEAQLLKTIKRRVERTGNYRIYKAQSTVYVEPLDTGCDIGAACVQLQRVFGIAAVNRALVSQKDFDAICRDTAAYLGETLQHAASFKVSAKRSDKSFAMDSMELSRQLGGYLLSCFPHLQVRMDDPQVTVVVEVRDYGVYIHSGKLPAAGGMPTGTSGRAAVMLSGGIDSPVAAWMMAKRGLDLCGVHFLSPPYTGERALDKVERLAHKISLYTGNFALLKVPFTDIQLAIRDRAPQEYYTVLMRRSMMRITELLCRQEHCDAIVTGESLAQVASQTLAAIQCTDQATALPVLRPLIGMDKVEIIRTARVIDTYDISIEPYEDCCTIFTPKHPKTKPKLADVLAAESAMVGLTELERQAAQSYTVKVAHFFD